MNHKLAKQQLSSRGPPLTLYADRGKTVGQRPLSAPKMLIRVVRLASLRCYRRGMNRFQRAAISTSGSLPITERKQNS